MSAIYLGRLRDLSRQEYVHLVEEHTYCMGSKKVTQRKMRWMIVQTYSL